MKYTRTVPWLALIAVTAACDQTATTPLIENFAAAQATVSPVVPTAQPEYVTVCKDGPAGTYTFTASGNFNLVTSPFTVDAGQCRDITLIGGTVAPVTVTETATPSGNIVLSHIDKYQFVQNNTPQIAMTTHAGPSVTGTVGGNTGGPGTSHGAVFVFFNVEVGGQGCTPGYWKQSQHFGNWTAPYTPGTAFAAVFENAFPGKTLLQVLELNGGGLNALGRHTVAALLNAASPSVNYGMTVAQVINAFNAVHPGTTAQYNAQKDIFEALNESGCPLGRNP